MIPNDIVAAEFKKIQDEICEALEELDGKSTFHEDLWERPGGGGGRTRIIQNGDILEKGGVNFSAVEGELPDALMKELKVDNSEFFATGVSIVLHPNHPLLPIIHMNIRYFSMSNGMYWFGGGIDLTPHYVKEELAKDFHSTLKNVCDQYDENYYSKFKKWADDYFYIPHRKETRGVGGIFFDKLKEDDNKSAQDIFDFVCAIGRSFASIYAHQVKAQRELPFTEKQKEWQMVRRGRYVEFNLVYDRGTKFGLETNGRIESILMSLPKNASWEYNYQVAENSDEEKTIDFLKKDIRWFDREK